MDDLTLITCAYNTPDILIGMLRSFAFHHGGGKLPVVIMENSTDELTTSILNENNIPYIRNIGWTHSMSIDPAFLACKTKYAIVVDSDIIFNKSISKLFAMFKKSGSILMGEVCGNRGGYSLHTRVHPWFMFVNVDEIKKAGIKFHDLKRITETQSDGFYNNIPIQNNIQGQTFYDVGSTFYEDIKAANLKIYSRKMDPEFFSHFEGMSWYTRVSKAEYKNLNIIGLHTFALWKRALDKYNLIDLHDRFC